MNVQVTLSKAEYEPMLMELLSKVMERKITPAEVRSVSVSYYPDSDNEMTIVLELPKDTNP